MKSLWQAAMPSARARRGEFLAPGASVRIAALAETSTLGERLGELRGRSVLLATREQLPAALALLELDGIARRIVLATPDLTGEQLADVARLAEADTIIQDAEPASAPPPGLRIVVPSFPPGPAWIDRTAHHATEWILLTSGTTGTPKLVVHGLESLGGTLPLEAPESCIWSTFYDIRRYGGLQIYLRAVLSGVPLVLASSTESTHDFLTRAQAARVTHISGTPSHWRRALMSGEAALLAPQYVRLSGEVADQPLLDRLKSMYPGAQVAHAFASTEAGVAFEVDDGLAGFPAELLAGRPGIDLKVEDGTLRIRSARNARRYLGDVHPPVRADDGYVDTGDLVELVGDRYHFRGRRNGVINVGGLKVFPEEVEAVLNADPRVRAALVRARKSPITGALVVADVVLREEALARDLDGAERVRRELLDACRRRLAAHKVPARLLFVPALALTPGGKLVRGHA